MKTQATHYIGVDVQASDRGCPFVVLDGDGAPVASDWLTGDATSRVAHIIRIADRFPNAPIGIDAPRQPLKSPRQWYWNGIHRRWRLRTTLEKGFGRHCEVVIAAHRLANPQWTPFREDAPPWMTLGFALFAGLAETTTYEVFPSASYTLLEDDASILAGLSLRGFSRGPKDMLDAYAAALTIREFERGLGTAVGDGDSLGQIILPRKIKNPITPVLNWPSERMDA